MEWDEAIEEAKKELGVRGWVEKDKWDEVVELAKEKYWSGETFRRLKKETIADAEGICKLCGKEKRLTAHHIMYGEDEETICLCKKCHELVHSPQIQKYGFVLQLVLCYWDYPDRAQKKFPHIWKQYIVCENEIMGEIVKRKYLLGDDD